ncbi:Nucleoporin SEH1 [Camelus dromedarius]|uniref:Nucleoporin SEH1 n=1 Tax=Camelus dromedarius TaxID=9838 RepID=A0A5N4CH81_CAMDR|nr:Nucleoporin SEH1 [Camelus dromedarius]
MGLMLATCSADGIVRVYEAPDVMNLSQWSLQHEISCKLSCSCISWNPSSSRAHPPMIAVGSDDSSPNAMAKAQIFEYNENTRKYAKAETLMTVTDPVHDIAFAPNLGRSFHILAIATKDVRIFTLKPVRKELTSSGGPTKFEIHIVAQFDNHNSQVWRDLDYRHLLLDRAVALAQQPLTGENPAFVPTSLQLPKVEES